VWAEKTDKLSASQFCYKGEKGLLIKGTPCPECDGFYFAIPWCSKCGWIDENWFKEELKVNEELMRLYREYQNALMCDPLVKELIERAEKTEDKSIDIKYFDSLRDEALLILYRLEKDGVFQSSLEPRDGETRRIFRLVTKE